MNLFDNGFKWGSGLVIGAGVVLLAPIVIPVVTGVLRSLAKATIKGSLIAYEKAKLVTAETIESIEDIAAEAKAEMAEGNKAE
jgi:hypothetical protein